MSIASPQACRDMEEVELNLQSRGVLVRTSMWVDVPSNQIVVNVSTLSALAPLLWTATDRFVITSLMVTALSSTTTLIEHGTTKIWSASAVETGQKFAWPFIVPANVDILLTGSNEIGLSIWGTLEKHMLPYGLGPNPDDGL